MAYIPNMLRHLNPIAFLNRNFIHFWSNVCNGTAGGGKNLQKGIEGDRTERNFVGDRNTKGYSELKFVLQLSMHLF